MICPVCGASSAGFTFVERWSAELREGVFEYTISQCGECRSELVEPRRAASPEWYAGGKEFYGWRWEFDRFLDDIRGLKVRKLRLLEIGCGEGSVLEKLRDDFDCWGIDFNVEALGVAKLKALKVFETLDLLKLQNPEIRFDVVAFFHVIEHLEQPLDFLRQIADVMNPDGHIFCSIPNPNRYTLKYQREDWDYPPHHLTRFTKAGLGRLLERASFRVTKGLEEPLVGEALKWAKRSAYKRLSLPKVLRQTIKWPLLVAFDLYLRILKRRNAGPSYYVAAIKDEL
jgi:2-polyprenyl-3-methyl-5-hydroxy-6-metoxy-1,4-benzoquinol methylase